MVPTGFASPSSKKSFGGTIEQLGSIDTVFLKPVEGEQSRKQKPVRV